MDSVADPRAATFEQAAREVIDPVRRFLARRTDPATAEDVLAEVLLVLWRRLDDVPEAVLPWTYGVARLCLANAERGVRRQGRLAARIAAVDPPRDVEPTEPDLAFVDAALAGLPPADAELLRLWAWEELGANEIATVLDISPNAASIRLHRAREKFKDALRKQGHSPGHEGLNEGSGT
ncbi:MAG: sigma-70 family RNA polymerase sigma factor [Microbacterium sp.]|nr:MAG: sigma-70 family RNA polymerase sigma factor [Microbacterium sp.]